MKGVARRFPCARVRSVGVQASSYNPHQHTHTVSINTISGTVRTGLTIRTHDYEHLPRTHVQGSALPVTVPCVWKEYFKLLFLSRYVLPPEFTRG